MTREITVIMKQEKQPPKTVLWRLIGYLNDIVRSPLFAFVFGSSIVALPPIFIGKAERDARAANEQAKADATMIAPFISMLDRDHKEKYEASRLALLELRDASTRANNGQERPIFTAVTKAIDSVGGEVYSKVPETASVDAEKVGKLIELEEISYDISQLRSGTMIYPQVSAQNKNSQKSMETIVEKLRQEKVLVQSTEKIDARKIPKKTQVRFFHSEDQFRAQQLAAFINSTKSLEVNVVYLENFKTKVKPGVLELWLSVQ